MPNKRSVLFAPEAHTHFHHTINNLARGVSEPRIMFLLVGQIMQSINLPLTTKWQKWQEVGLCFAQKNEYGNGYGNEEKDDDAKHYFPLWTEPSPTPLQAEGKWKNVVAWNSVKQQWASFRVFGVRCSLHSGFIADL